MNDGIYRIVLTGDRGEENGAFVVRQGRFQGAGLGYHYQGRLESRQAPEMRGTVIVRKAADHAAPLLGQFKEAALEISGTFDAGQRTFAWSGQARGHHTIRIQASGSWLGACPAHAGIDLHGHEGCILLLRHGAVNRPSKVLMGGGDHLLNDTGLLQALAWQDAFQAHPPASVFCSPLGRALQTSRLAVPGSTDGLLVRQGLREIRLGAWEGLRKEEIEAISPGAWEARGSDFAGYRPEGGESFQDVLDRALPVFQEMAAVAQAHDESVLAVTHAGVIRVLLCHILGMPLNNLFRLQVDCAGLTMVQSAAGGWRVRCFNMPPAS
jgi:probable phosphoglycerate mutase